MEIVSGISNWELTVRREAAEIIILRAVTCDAFAALPDELWGLPVKALEKHALAPGAGVISGEAVRISCGPPAADTVWDNRNLQELTLPAALDRVGDYALFNCVNLKTLRLGDCVRHWGGGVLMNCRRLDTFQIDCSGLEGELLAYFAEELPGELDMTLRRGGETSARLIFPEYVEAYEENCPAHHFDYNIYGAGYGYHHCFSRKRLDLKAYDALWRPMLSTEHDGGCALRLAWWRLRYPEALTASAAADYQAYLRIHETEALQYLLSLRDVQGLRVLLAGIQPSEKALSVACALAREYRDAASLAVLLEERHRRFPVRTERDFTL